MGDVNDAQKALIEAQTDLAVLQAKRMRRELVPVEDVRLLIEEIDRMRNVIGRDKFEGVSPVFVDRIRKSIQQST